MANHRHKKIVKMAKGYRGRTNCFRIAVQRVEKALQYAYRDRKVGKGLFSCVGGTDSVVWWLVEASPSASTRCGIAQLNSLMPHANNR